MSRLAVLAGLAATGLAIGPHVLMAQGPRGLPRMTIPEVPQEAREARPDEPLFRAEVTRVEVSVLVLDGKDQPVRGLTQADFEVFEDGQPQVVRSFTPYSHEPGLLVLPDPRLPATPDAVVVANPQSNYYASASRVFALILDDLHVDVRRTTVARAAARRLVEQLEPSDLLFVVASSSGESTGFFSRDRAHALKMIDGFMGQRLLNQTIARRQEAPSGAGVQHDDSAGRYDHYLRLTGTIRDVSLAMREVSGRRKTVVLLSEGSSFGAGMENMVIRMPKATDRTRVNSTSGTLRLMNDALAAAAAGNVAVYPLSPAGLGGEEADLIRGFGAVDQTALMAVLTEAQQAKEMLRDLAALTGGVSLVDTNEPLAGIDRAMADASFHYVLTYEPERPARGDEYRRIEVKVKRPGVRVLARRGYRAPGVRPPPALKVPGSLSPQLRTLLAGIMPDDGLPMRVEAVALSRKDKATTVAVVVEVNGTLLAPAPGQSSIDVEQGLLTVNESGKASNGERKVFDLRLSPVQREVLGASGLRTVWAVDLPAGRHQVRVGTVDRTSGRGGSVYLEIEVPRSGLSPGALVASRFLSMMPTAFADKRLDAWTLATPTATRVFPLGDVLTVTTPHVEGSVGTRARLLTASGDVAWEGSGVPQPGRSAAQFVVPLDGLAAGVFALALETSHGHVQVPVGIIAPQATAPHRSAQPGSAR